MSAPLHQSNFTYGISDTPMSSYTDDGNPPASLEKFVTVDQQSAEYSVGTANNEGHSTGTDWATEQWIETHDVNIPFNIEPSVLMLRRLLRASFGGVANTQPEVGAELDTFTPQNANTSRQLPAYWIAEKCGSIHNVLYPSCVLEAATFKGEATGRLQVSGNFRGSGQRIDDDDYTINAVEADKYYLKNTQSEIIRATAATPGTPVKTYSCGLQMFEFGVDNAHNQSVGYDPGCQRFFNSSDPDSGIIRSHHLFGRRKYTSKFVIWMEDSSVEYALLKSQAELDIKMSMEGSIIVGTTPHLVRFQLHLAHYTSVVIGEKDGYVTMEIVPEAFYDESNSRIVKVELQYPTIS